jgi:BASS family bile acid:Na+ symporter
VLALATATRHPGLAMGIAHVTGIEDKTIAGAVLLTLLVAVIVSAPYVKWRKRVHAEPALR